jgi:hypothetical protein
MPTNGLTNSVAVILLVDFDGTRPLLPVDAGKPDGWLRSNNDWRRASSFTPAADLTAAPAAAVVAGNADVDGILLGTPAAPPTISKDHRLTLLASVTELLGTSREALSVSVTE